MHPGDAVMASQPVVDLSFPVYGDAIPADHGYVLFSAISRVWPEVHADPLIGIHPLSGRLIGGRMLALTPASRLILRLPADRIRQALTLAGKGLPLGEGRIVVGVPVTRALQPHSRLISRLVVIRGFTEPDAFLEAVQRQLAERGIGGQARLVERRRPRSLEGRAGSSDRFVRRTLRVHDREIVGYAVRVDGLAPEDSLRLQAVGIGGRRRFGCGIFVPVARAKEWE